MRIMKVNNPFILTGYVSPVYFCDRREETRKILSAVENNRNLTLFSIRRIGKTGLIEHAFHNLQRQKKYNLIYLDILPTSDLKDFINVFAKAVISGLETKPEQFFNKIGELFSSIRPTVSFDPITGIPNIQFNLETDKEVSQTLEKIFKYIKKQKKRIVIAIDEFQQIVNYPEKNVEATLRANVQSTNNATFIFSGSHKHILLSMFGKYGRPFYQSTELLHLEKIEYERYKKFIGSKFEKGKKRIKDEHIDRILKITRNHTYYVQFFCNRLYGLPFKSITDEIIGKTLLDILQENESVYINYRNLLTSSQWNLLEAIAKEGSAKKLLSKEFIKTHSLTAASSVQTALAALLNKEMIYKEDNYYFIYDVFFERWLERI